MFACFDSRYEMQILKNRISVCWKDIASEPADGSGKVVVVGHMKRYLMMQTLDIRYCGRLIFSLPCQRERHMSFPWLQVVYKQVMENQINYYIEPCFASMIMEDKIHELALKVKDDLSCALIRMTAMTYRWFGQWIQRYRALSRRRVS